MMTDKQDVDDALIGADARFQPIHLTSTCAFEANILSVPINVMNPKASRSSKRLASAWKTDGSQACYAMKRDDDVAFPLLRHAEIFHTMLAMFVQRPNDDGVLYFRLSDIVKNLGKNREGGSIYTTIKEAIWRYSKCTVEWHQAWAQKGVKPDNWDGPLIIENNVFSTSEFRSRILRANPRRGCHQALWHSITFHPRVTKSIKNQYVRVFLTEILHSDLSDAAKCVYRYFYRFSDSTAVHRDYWQLMGAFAWASNKTRFVIWLKKQLNELKEYGVVEDFVFAPGNVSVKCAPISAIKTAKKVSTKTITLKEADHASTHVH
jgi:hypothetical protein